MRWLVERFKHLGSISKWGWAALGCAWTLVCSADTLIAHLAPSSLQERWNSWWHPHFGSKDWAIGVLVILLLMLWEGSYRHSRVVINQLNNAEGKLRRIGDSRPNIVLCGKSVEPIAFYQKGSQMPWFSALFVKARFINKPVESSQGSEARGVRAKISFYDSSKSLLFGDMDGRWDSTDQPSSRQYGTTRNDLLAMNFGIEEVQGVDIAFWDTKTRMFVAFNNDSWNFAMQDYTKPGHELASNPVTAVIRLHGVEVNEAFSMTFGADAEGNVTLLD